MEVVADTVCLDLARVKDDRTGGGFTAPTGEYQQAKAGLDDPWGQQSADAPF
jgi:hypothetical protein